MAELSRYFPSLRTVRAIVLSGLVLFARPAFACEACVPSGMDEAEKGITIGKIVDAANQEIQSIGQDFTNFIGPLTTGIPGSGVTCTTMSTCMQMYFSELAGTNTNNQLMQSSVNAKGYDYLAMQQYSQGLQSNKANLVIQNATGQTLQYQNNNLCTPATMSTGMSAISAGATSTVASMGAPGRIQNFTPSTAATDSDGVPISTVSGEFNSSKSAPKRVNDMFAAIKTDFYDSSLPNASDPASGKYPHADTDVATNDSKTEFVIPNDITAYDQYINYIVGLPPENPSTDSSYRGTAQGQQAVVAEHEKIAFRNLAQLAFNLDEANRKPLTGGANSPAAKSVIAMFTAAGETLQGVNGAVSKADLMKAMYQELAENPSTIGNINGLAELPTLQYIAGLMVFSNYLRYQRYLNEERDLRVNSAMLALQARTVNFDQNP